MRIVKQNNLRILCPAYGYILRHIESGNVYTGKIYLGINASMDEYEEIKDHSIDERLEVAIEDVEAKEASLMKIGKIVANQVTDDIVALSIQEFYDDWVANTPYNIGQYVKYNDILYKTLTSHNSQDDWTPDISPGLFAKVLTDPTGETILDWVQPDSTNAYMKGDKVRYEGVIYESIVDNNIWSPAEYPAGWQII